MSLELFLGPMFAGKSSAVLGIVRRNKVIHRRTLCVTSALDKRYTEEAQIVSHNKESHPAMAVGQLVPLLEHPEFHAAECIIVEEAQFFTDLTAFVLPAVETHGKHVICVGLDGDSERRPFGQLLDLIPYADSYQKFTALCSRCSDGTPALFTYRKAGAPTTQISVGGQNQYEALCRTHFLQGQFFNAEVALGPQKGDAAPKQLNRFLEKYGLREGSDAYAELHRVLGTLPA